MRNDDYAAAGHVSWRLKSDRILNRLFVRGQPAPSDAEIRNAYPFGERRYHPYKVWLTRVRAWKAAHAIGLRAWYAPRRRDSADPQQEEAFPNA